VCIIIIIIIIISSSSSSSSSTCTCPPPHRGKGLRRGLCPLPRKFFDFWAQKGAFWCILGVIFAVELKWKLVKPLTGEFWWRFDLVWKWNLYFGLARNAFLLCCINLTANEYGWVWSKWLLIAQVWYAHQIIDFSVNFCWGDMKYVVPPVGILGGHVPLIPPPAIAAPARLVQYPLAPAKDGCVIWQQQ